MLVSHSMPGGHSRIMKAKNVEVNFDKGHGFSISGYLNEDAWDRSDADDVADYNRAEAAMPRVSVYRDDCANAKQLIKALRKAVDAVEQMVEMGAISVEVCGE